MKAHLVELARVWPRLMKFHQVGFLQGVEIFLG